MKAEALAKMLGLDHFMFMVWSKTKYDWEQSDEELLAAFKKRFTHCLPIDYLDMVLVDDIAEKIIPLTGT